MYEFFKDSLNPLQYYRLDYDGKLFKLDMFLGTWCDVTEHEEFSTAFMPCEEEEINYFRLFIYVEQSTSYFYEHCEEVGIKDYKYGEDYKFYITEDGVIAIDSDKNSYICSPKIMVPTMTKIVKVQEAWAELSLENVIDYIENQEGIFMYNMDLYYDENGDVIGFTEDSRKFKLSLKSGELNEVFDNNMKVGENWKPCYMSDKIFDDENNEILLSVRQCEQMKDLYDYLNKTGDYGKFFIYYENPFGCIYALGEDEQEYICGKDHLIKLEKGTINREYMRISRFYVAESVEHYYKHKEELATKEIKVQDLVLFITPEETVNGLTEDEREFTLVKETGELKQVPTYKGIRNNMQAISPAEGVKLQAIYKSNAELNNYLDYCREKLEKENKITTGTDFEFFGEPVNNSNDEEELFNFYAIDNLNNEYYCTTELMKPVEKGTVSKNWKKIESVNLLKYLNNLSSENIIR